MGDRSSELGHRFLPSSHPLDLPGAPLSSELLGIESFKLLSKLFLGVYSQFLAYLDVLIPWWGDVLMDPIRTYIAVSHHMEQMLLKAQQKTWALTSSIDLSRL